MKTEVKKCEVNVHVTSDCGKNRIDVIQSILPI